MDEQTSHRETYNAGLVKRRHVVGDDYVDRALATMNDFTKPMQDLVTEYCWGTVWTRPGLDDKTRSFLNLAMLTALNRPTELATHVRGALTNGATPEEIQEVLLQTAIYVGVPAALESFRIADQVLSEHRDS